MVRPVIAQVMETVYTMYSFWFCVYVFWIDENMPSSPKLQYYRRGCRNFSSSGSNNNGDVVDRGFKELARSVMTTCCNYGVGLAFGSGSGMYSWFGSFPDSDFISLSFNIRFLSLLSCYSRSRFRWQQHSTIEGDWKGKINKHTLCLSPEMLCISL